MFYKMDFKFIELKNTTHTLEPVSSTKQLAAQSKKAKWHLGQYLYLLEESQVEFRSVSEDRKRSGIYVKICQYLQKCRHSDDL